MNILRRGAPAEEAKSKEPIAEPAMGRRVKVTVERETVTVLMRGQPEPVQEPSQTIEGEPEGGRVEPESGPLKLLPPACKNNGIPIG